MHKNFHVELTKAIDTSSNKLTNKVIALKAI